MPRMHWFRMAGVAVTVAACSRGRTEAVRPVDAPVRVHVTNNHALPVDISIAGSGTTRRLGTVHPGMVADFTVPLGMVGGSPVEFRSASAAGDSYRSGEILIPPGSIVDFVVAARMFSSTAVLRP
jgi:hypothetical protein